VRLSDSVVAPMVRVVPTVTSLLRLGLRKFVTLIRNHESSPVRASFGKARYLDRILVNSRHFGCLIICWVCGTEQLPAFIDYHPHATTVRVPACYDIQQLVFILHGALGSHEPRSDATAGCRLNWLHHANYCILSDQLAYSNHGEDTNHTTRTLEFERGQAKQGMLDAPAIERGSINHSVINDEDEGGHWASWEQVSSECVHILSPILDRYWCIGSDWGLHCSSQRHPACVKRRIEMSCNGSGWIFYSVSTKKVLYHPLRVAHSLVQIRSPRYSAPTRFNPCFRAKFQQAGGSVFLYPDASF
jgi:hypothetical protein